MGATMQAANTAYRAWRLRRSWRKFSTTMERGAVAMEALNAALGSLR